MTFPQTWRRVLGGASWLGPHPTHDFPVAAVQRKCHPHFLTVVA
jgi:hypothetical protein